MAKRNQTYQYKNGDDPVSVAGQFGITPQALLDANPGGSPFSIGQTISIPFQYSAAQQQPFGPQPPINQFGGTSMSYGPVLPPTPAADVGSGVFQPPINQFGGTSMNYGPALPPGTTPAPNTPYMMGRGGGQTAYLPEGMNYQRYTPGAGGQQTLGKGDFYGYERDPETGRSVRVVKNSATSNFLNELRWDPQRRKYVSIGRLLKQGKLDLKGNWNKKGKKKPGGGGGSDLQTQVQINQDYTLTNSFISFNASAG